MPELSEEESKVNLLDEIEDYSIIQNKTELGKLFGNQKHAAAEEVFVIVVGVQRSTGWERL
jgi:ribosomal protein L7Ae-like RNA K-turn-binding protein